MILPRVKYENNNGEKCVLPCEIIFSSDDFSKKISNLIPLFIEGVKVAEGDNPFISFKKLDDLKNEEYKILTGEKIEIFYKDYLSIRNAVATLSGMLDNNRSFCTGEISDYPECSYRGLMIDLARGVEDISTLKADLLLAAKSKMNYIHLHFFDSPGSAIKINSFPKEAYLPGAYSVEEVKELMAFCDIIGLEVIPEFDLPAHSGKMIECFPEIACITNNPNQTSWTVCAGSERLFEIYEAVISELAAIFNSKYFHVGGDEIEFADRPELGRLCHWDECERCKSYMEANGIKDRQELWYDLLLKVYSMVKKAGKTMVMWSDQLDCERDIPIPRDVIMQFWRVALPGRGPYKGCSMNAQLKAGFKIINSDFPNTYADLEQYINPSKLKDWSPYKEPGSDEALKENIMGTELCAWEYGNKAKYSHYAYSLPSAIVLMADKLWNLDSLPYGEEYSAALTKAVLGAGTPEGFDVFKCFGDTLPPRSDEKIYKEKITISDEEMSKALDILANMKESPRAAVYRKTIIDGLLQNGFEKIEGLD
ncbi:MAG: hypothetical protein E7411_03180 [Ruminococcaceae bacterium]|nr:hypothetical protein [Oscillospiraceae bacterium]